MYSPVHTFQPTALWAGRWEADGLYFDERSVESGIGEGSTGWDYALVDADLDSDGHRELISAGHLAPLAIWDNPCGEGDWIELDLLGVGDNQQAYGARAELTAGGVTHIREVHSLSLVSQSPATLHFGLSGSVEALRVVFPDGAVVESSGFPAKRHVTVSHPDR